MFLFDWLGWFALAALAGWFASIATGTNQRPTFFLDVLIGLAGAFLGSALISLLPFVRAEITGLTPRSLFIAFIGAWIIRTALKAVQDYFSESN